MCDKLEISPIALFRSPLKDKFGLPRQAGLNTSLRGTIELLPEYRSAEALRGLDGFDYIWIIWQFSLSHSQKGLTVRPPALGGNERMGVFATRSPFRPCPLGLSSVRILDIDFDAPDGPLIHVKGADLADGTPIFDIKPYLPFTDAHPDARSGFTAHVTYPDLEVVMPERIPEALDSRDIEAIRTAVGQDPRPRYHHDGDRIYSIRYKAFDVKVRFFQEGKAKIIEIAPFSFSPESSQA